jgi:hydrogenase maturation protein HypF
VNSSAYVSQHIGDLDTVRARSAHARSVRDLQRLYEARPAILAEDLHPDYASTKESALYAQELAASGMPAVRVPIQHHYAHILSCMAEHGLSDAVLGVAWDGTGLGPDGTVWGGEWLVADTVGYRRVGHLRHYPLPGGEAAVKEPRRSALGALYACAGGSSTGLIPSGDHGWSAEDLATLVRMMDTGVNCPITSSAGRLFDAVASLAGVRHVTRFEGQAAMELEWAVQDDVDAAAYQMPVRSSNGVYVADWEPMLRRILSDVGTGLPVAAISRGFHDALVAGIVTIAEAVGITRVVLTGGCFLNRYLTERSAACLQDAGFRPYYHQRVPPNDGGIALGQVYAARGQYREVQ